MKKDLAISAQGISKKYQIGSGQRHSNHFFDVIKDTIASPIKKIKGLVKGAPAASFASNETIWALKDISFDVKQGEVLGVVGSNGAGKSTLLKILSRITKPTEGRVEIHGRLGSLLEVGTGFHPELTGRDNIFLNGAILGMKRNEISRQFNQIVAFAEIDKFIDTPVKYYSSGMYIRLAFAVAAHLEPEILIVDEVLAVGDVRFQKKCLGKMEDIARQGRTVLFVSHNMPAVRNFCTRALLLKDGKMVTQGATDKVLKEYLEGNMQHQGLKVWPKEARPSNASFRINSVSLVDQDDCSVVKISRGAAVEIEYEVYRQGAQVGFSLVLFDTEGHCIFSSLSNLETLFYGKPLECGVYRSKCFILPHLLNEGKYYISITGFSGNRSDFISVDRVLYFEAIDDGVLRGDFPGNFQGFIRPKLEWNTEKVSGSIVN